MKQEENNNENAFLPEGYEAPVVGGFTKFEDGENRIRIMSKPVMGWIDWDEKKPLRFGYKYKPEAPIDPKKPIKHFWAMIIWNYKAKCIQILEITQVGIQNKIQSLSKDEEWGAPFFYDLKIIKEGSGKETVYVVNPSPKKPLTEEQQKASLEKRINLEALFSNGDPYAACENPTALHFQSLPF